MVPRCAKKGKNIKRGGAFFSEEHRPGTPPQRSAVRIANQVSSKLIKRNVANFRPIAVCLHDVARKSPKPNGTVATPTTEME